MKKKLHKTTLQYVLLLHGIKWLSVIKCGIIVPKAPSPREDSSGADSTQIVLFKKCASKVNEEQVLDLRSAQSGCSVLPKDRGHCLKGPGLVKTDPVP